MKFVTYQQVTQKEIVDKVRNRYWSNINVLKEMGFEELCYCNETLFPFSFILLFPILLFFLVKKEVIKVQGPLRISGFRPLLVSREYATYAYVSSHGAVFYTSFHDGTVLKSANLFNREIKSRKDTSSPALESAWGLHRDSVDKFRVEGKQIYDDFSFEEFLKVMSRENKIGIGPQPVRYAALGAWMTVFGIFELISMDYIAATGFLASGSSFLLKSCLGRKIKSDNLRKTVVYTSMIVGFIAFVIWMLKLLLTFLGLLLQGVS